MGAEGSNENVDNKRKNADKYACEEYQTEKIEMKHENENIDNLNDFWKKQEIKEVVDTDDTDNKTLSLSLSAPEIMSHLTQFEESVLERKGLNAQLRLYLKQRLCEEILLFYNDYKWYLMANSQIMRNRRGKKMKELYIVSKGKRELNLSHQTKKKFQEVMIENNNQYNKDSFDMIVAEILYLMKYSIWPGFVKMYYHKKEKTLPIAHHFGLENKIIIKNQTENANNRKKNKNSKLFNDFTDIFDSKNE